MKKGKRVIQAIVVIMIVGAGWVHNLDRDSAIYRRISTVNADWKDEAVRPDSVQVEENNLYILTRDIINSGIEHLISNI